MAISVIFAVLGAALLHATWNLIVKAGGNKLFETAINALGGGLGALFILPFISLPSLDCCLMLLLSCFCHFVYYLWIADAYRHADLSLGYTLMRGTAPVLTACAMTFLGSTLNFYGWLGIALLCGGILSLAFDQIAHRHGSLLGIGYSLRTSLAICGYTLADGLGARMAEDSLIYTGWLFIINLFPISVYVLIKYKKQFLYYLKGRALIGICGGLCSLGSYGIAIWAMTVAPIALVAALRESSVIFGMLLAVCFLGEKLGPVRLMAIILVFGGACLSRLG